MHGNKQTARSIAAERFLDTCTVPFTVVTITLLTLLSPRPDKIDFSNLKLATNGRGETGNHG